MRPSADAASRRQRQQHHQQQLTQWRPSLTRPAGLPTRRLPADGGSGLRRPRTSTCVAASSRPPGPEYAALEAAVGAINSVLAANNKLKGRRGQQQGGSNGGAAGGGDAAAAAASSADPGKLVTFRAKASGSRDVTVRTARTHTRTRTRTLAHLPLFV